MERVGPVTIERHSDGQQPGVSITFGPHYFVDIYEDGWKVTFQLGTTHHGFRADASEVGGELERFIDEVKQAHSENSF